MLCNKWKNDVRVQNEIFCRYCERSEPEEASIEQVTVDSVDKSIKVIHHIGQ